MINHALFDNNARKIGTMYLFPFFYTNRKRIDKNMLNCIEQTCNFLGIICFIDVKSDSIYHITFHFLYIV